MRFPLLASLAIALLCWLAGAAMAEDTSLLYRATAIVTGQGEENRQVGFRLCLEDVIVRVSGDYRLVTSGKAQAAIDDAASFVSKFSYRDRLEGIPVHDEQGTHDRPHDLTVDFDTAKVDAALAAMGSRPWLDARPRLAIFLGVRNAASRFMLAADGEQGSYMRDSFTGASNRIAIPIGFVPTAILADGGLSPHAVGDADLGALDAGLDRTQRRLACCLGAAPRQARPCPEASAPHRLCVRLSRQTALRIRAADVQTAGEARL